MSLARYLSKLGSLMNGSGQLLEAAHADGSISAAKLASGAARANFGAGAVLQVVHAVSTSYTAISGTNETSITGMSASITPSSASSKILILANIGELRSPTTVAARFQLYRNGSKRTDMINELGYGLNTSSQIGMVFSWPFVDTPNTTSQLTYAIYGRKLINTTGTLEIMPNGASTSSIILMEIAG